MALKNLKEQLHRLGDAVELAMLNPNLHNTGRISEEYRKLKYMINGLTDFVEHTWEVKLIFGPGVVSELVDLKAEHLEEARAKAIEMFDRFDSAVNYELYCDGQQIPEHE